MAQRINKKNLFLEILAVLIILATLILLIDKYLLHNKAKSSIARNVEQSVNDYIGAKDRQEAIIKNALYTKQTSKRNKVINKFQLNLLIKNGKWVIENNNSETNNPKYFLTTKNGQLSINNPSTKKRFRVAIESVGENVSFQGRTILDLPAQGTAKNFRLYEQEDYLPIFGYHYVSPDSSTIEERRHFLQMHISDFRKQLEYLTNDLNCHWITFGEIMEDYVLQNKKIPRRTCAMTFDDGHKDSYKYIFPVLKELNIPASFYIITGLVGKPGYVTWKQLDEMYHSGNELGAHTASAEGLLKTDWFEKKYNRPFTHDDMVFQITESKKKLLAEGYNPTTFAYPLGEWNNEVVKIIKEAGFITARDTSREHTTLDPRTPTVSISPKIIWHMHYYKPEVDDLKTLGKKMGYNTWWQFEDGYKIEDDSNNNIKQLSSLRDLTSHTYEIISLPDATDKISNKFLLANDGNYTMEIFASTGDKKNGPYSNLSNIKVTIDKKPLDLKPGNSQKCQLRNNRYYCSFFLKASLEKGTHLLSVESNHSAFIRLDKFRLFREFTLKKKYKLTIIEYANR